MAAVDPTAAAIDEKAQRVRNLLSSYYGTPAPSSATDSPTSDAASTPLSRTKTATFSNTRTAGGIDSAGFDAERYLNQLLRTTRMDALLLKHIEMTTEIKSLDSDMQMLVYENYNKFISATDTIRSMKSNVDGMDSNMHELKQIIESVADKSNAVNSKLQLRRDHIEELNQVRGLLFKLQAVFDLPKRLRAALDQGAVEIAVNSYADAAPLLKRYGHKGAFRKVAAEADACAKELTQLLKQRMVTQKDEAAECIQMVRKLGEPIESLQEEFLLCMKKRMEAILEDAEAVSQAIASSYAPASGAEAEPRLRDAAAWGFEGRQPPALARFVVELDQRFLTELAHTAALFNELFEPSGRKRLLKVTREAFAQYLKVVKRALTSAANAESAAAMGLSVTGAEVGPPAFGKDWGAATLSAALYTISNDVTRVQSLLPELSPQDRGTEVVEGAVRQHIGACFGALERRVLNAVEQTQARLDGSAADGAAGEQNTLQGQVLLQAFTGISELVLRGSESILAGMRVYRSSQWVLRSWQDVFVDLVQGQLQHLFLSLLAGFVSRACVQPEGLDLPPLVRASDSLASPSGQSAASPQAAGAKSSAKSPLQAGPAQRPGTPSGEASEPATREPPPPGLVLLLARLCAFMEMTAVLHVMEIIAVTFPGQGAGSGGDQPPAFVAGEVARRLGTAAQLLLAGYVEAHGRRLSLAVRRSVDATNWLQHKEPRGPRPICDLLIERLANAEAEVVQLVDDGGHRPKGGSGRVEGASTPIRDVSGGEGNALERNVARLFREKVNFFGVVELTQASILAGITRVGLKSLVEGVRLQTLSRAGLQQLQLDVHYLRPLLRRFAQGSEGTIIYHLLDEVLTAAVERSLEPSLLEAPVLDRIMASASQQQRA
ncbi:hypothetical protein WJX72_011382 [[Myrmecia] bisecta]|uniref:Vacuolar protein sorting-associated protein 51 homolog n=1 Tax=[Myrmecia] bisecta TaxID=41462 RepID=A0AAW1PYN3_9CHLO